MNYHKVKYTFKFKNYVFKNVKNVTKAKDRNKRVLYSFFCTVSLNHSATQDVYVRWGRHTGKQ